MMKHISPLLLIPALLLGVMGWLSACQNAQTEPWMDPSAIGRWESERSAMVPVEQQGEWATDVFGNQAGHTFDDRAIALAHPGDDLWIIVKPPKHDDQQPPDRDDEHPGAGAMAAVIPPIDDAQEPTLEPMPLKHTDVKATVTGYIATVDVTQQFHNPFNEKIEAVYRFPLPQDAAVSAFVMEVGPPGARRQIRGVVREKEEAERIYRVARAQGLNASLLTQVRPNIFEQKVANIEPGKQIDIRVRYFNTLSYSDGWYAFTFPMVVGPRFNPPESIDPVRAAGRGRSTGPADTEGAAVAYLRPDERSGHDIALTLDIDAGVSIEEGYSPTHDVLTEPIVGNPNAMRVALSPNDAIPNKDFVFTFRVAGQTMKRGLVTHIDDRGRGYFSLMLYPPNDLTQLERQPMEMVFVLDTSGSMSGEPMRQAKAAVRHALQQLRPADTFQIIRFSSDISAFGPEPVPATRDNIRRAIRYLDTLAGGGGTMMIRGVRQALDFPHDPDRFRVVTFLTDGYIGNEQEVLAVMSEHLGEARVFSFGVGSSTNRYLLQRMAKLGRGAAAYLLPGGDGGEVMDLFFQRANRPAMTDIAIDWGNAQVSQVYPERTPDLLVGRPVILTGRYTGELSGIHITGQAGGQAVSVTVDADSAAAQHPALAQVWARRKIAGLMDAMTLAGGDTHKPAVLETALDYQLVSAYTAFLAVDASRITEGGGGTTVVQPVPVPEGVRYDTTVAD